MSEKPRRFIDSLASKLFGAALSLSSLDACSNVPKQTEVSSEAVKGKEDNTAREKQERSRGVELLAETDVMKKEWFGNLPHVEYDRLRVHLPGDMREMDDDELTAALKDIVKKTSEEVEDKIKKARFSTEAYEEEYFSRLKKEKTKKRILAAVARASEVTGVSEERLIAIGCMESQWNEEAENLKTNVFGPLQMKLPTAVELAARMNEQYGLALSVSSPEDIKNIETAVLLGAGHIQVLTNKYGKEHQDLAIAAYASGGMALDEKIHELFPEIDFGTTYEEKRIAHSKKMEEIKEKIKDIKQKKKRLPQDDIVLNVLRRSWKEHNDGYRESLKKELEIRKKLPSELGKYGVSVYTLYSEKVSSPDGQSHGFSDKHSLEYAIAIDTMIGYAHRHMEKGEE